MSSTSIACALHSSEATLGPCTRCGTFVCGECGEVFERLLACRSCVKRLGLPLTLTGQVVVGLIFALPTLAILAVKLRAPSEVLWVLSAIPVVGILFLVREVLLTRYRGTSAVADVLLTSATLMALIELGIGAFSGFS